MNRSIVMLVAALFLSVDAAFAQIIGNRISFQPSASIALDAWSLLDGGAGSGERAMGIVDFGTDFVLSDTLEGHLGAFVFAGDRDVDAFTGDFGVFSNIITDSRYILFTAWLQHSFEGSHIRIGQLASDESFYVSEAGSLFINSNFGAIPTVSANVSAPIFSVGSAGIEYFKNLDNGYYHFGVYAGDPGPGDRDDHGFHWSAGGDAGYFFIAENGWNYGTSEYRNGQLKVGAYFHSGQFESFVNDATGNGNYSFYTIVDQNISESFSAFARFGYNPKSEYSVVDRYFDLGLNWAGVFKNRPDDVFGIAYSQTRFSGDYRTAVDRSEDRILNSERVFEITYAAEFANGWQVQPSVQWIENPYNATDDALLAGIRLSMDY